MLLVVMILKNLQAGKQTSSKDNMSCVVSAAFEIKIKSKKKGRMWYVQPISMKSNNVDQ